MNEVWKDINGYEGFYQISNFGRVRSIDRICGKMPNGSNRCIKGKIMTPTDNGKGYLVIQLKRHGKRKPMYVHRLVADHFLEKQIDKNIVDHIDYDKSNNRADNLRWCTQKENIQHSRKNMIRPLNNARTNTRQKYITKRNGKYQVHVRIASKAIYRTFGTLEEAMFFRNEVLYENSIAI